MTRARLISEKMRLMGSPFSIEAYVPESVSDEQAKISFHLAFAEIKRIEDLLTDFRESPLNQINQMAGQKPVKVCHEIFELIQQAIRFSQESEGAFDISYASVGHLWRMAQQKGIPLTPDEITDAKQWINFRLIELNENTREVFLPHPKMKIGMGGIGKGYAVDRAYHTLRTCGLENFFVNGAGDVRVHSSDLAPRAWRIAVRNPFSENPNQAMGCLEIKNGSIATSGDYERFFEYQKKRYHHVLDGRSGEITQAVSSATVLAREALTADVYATILMVLGPEKGLEFLNQKKNTSGFLITPSGKTLASQSLKLPSPSPN